MSHENRRIPDHLRLRDEDLEGGEVDKENAEAKLAGYSKPVGQEKGSKPKGFCEWFALCDNRADGSVEHPILGGVPTCGPCVVRLNLQKNFTPYPGRTAWNREGHEPCEKGTVGCSVHHAGETKQDNCQTW